MNASSRDEPRSDRVARETSSPSDFLELVERAHALHQGGEDEEALALAQRAQQLAARDDLPDSRQIAYAHRSLGVIFFETGFNRAALPVYGAALAIAERLEPRDDDLLASLHNNLGQVEFRLGQLARARSLLETAVSMREKASPESMALGIALDNLAAVCGALGELDRAEALHRRALALFERSRGPLDTHVATALGNLSRLYLRRRDFERAEAYRLRALDTHERLCGLAHAETLIDITNLAELYLEKGDQARADQLISLLLSIGGDRPGRTHRSLAGMIHVLARRALADFRLDLGERLAARAVELFQAIEGAHAPETLEALQLLANFQRAVGQGERASENLRRALSGYEARGMRDETVVVTIDLGKVYRAWKAYPLAKTMFDAAIEQLRREPQRDNQLLASALGNLAELFYDDGQYEAAERTYAEALAAIEDEGSYGERPWLLHGQAMLKYHLGQHAAALELYEQAKRLWAEERGGDHPFVATTAGNLALVSWAAGDIERALASFAEAETLTDREMQRVLAVGSETKRAAYAREAIQGNLFKVVSFCLAAGSRRPEIGRFAAQMLLRRKGRVLDAIAHTLFRVRENLRPEDQVLINRLDTVRGEVAGLIAPTLVSRRAPQDRDRLRALRDEEEQLEAALSYRGALYRPGLEPVTLAAVQECIPPDGALIELLRFPPFEPTRTGTGAVWQEDRYAALVLRAFGEPRWFDLGPAATVDARADALRRLLRNRSSEAAPREAEAQALHALLIEPLRDALADARRLLVSPDGSLTLIPFGLLRDGAGRRLSERYVVSYLTAGRELRQSIAAAPQTNDVVVIADPNFDAEMAAEASGAAGLFAARGGFSRLPGSQQEAEEIEKLLGNVTALTGSRATVEALKAVQRPSVLHVATHGLFAPMPDDEVSWGHDAMLVGEEMLLVSWTSRASLANPMFFSGLVLAGANKRTQGASTGILTAQEIAGLNLRGTQLVVLSACETGLGTIRRIDEFTGLRRALAIAGAATQVTSLWRVSDEATRVLMGHYYRLLVDGHDRAAALQLAQERVAHDPAHPEWEHPFYWAAFVSAGAWAPMQECLVPRA